MKEEEFQKFVKSSRQCDPNLLDAAVDRGIKRAKADRTDWRKIVGLAGMSAATAALLFIANPADDTMAAQGRAEVLQMHLADLARILSEFLEGVMLQ